MHVKQTTADVLFSTRMKTLREDKDTKYADRTIISLLWAVFALLQISHNVDETTEKIMPPGCPVRRVGYFVIFSPRKMVKFTVRRDEEPFVLSPIAGSQRYARQMSFFVVKIVDSYLRSLDLSDTRSRSSSERRSPLVGSSKPPRVFLKYL